MSRYSSSLAILREISDSDQSDQHRVLERWSLACKHVHRREVLCLRERRHRSAWLGSVNADKHKHKATITIVQSLNFGWSRIMRLGLKLADSVFWEGEFMLGDCEWQRASA